MGAEKCCIPGCWGVISLFVPFNKTTGLTFNKLWPNKPGEKHIHTTYRSKRQHKTQHHIINVWEMLYYP